jgi:hypothetical protein
MIMIVGATCCTRVPANGGRACACTRARTSPKGEWGRHAPPATGDPPLLALDGGSPPKGGDPPGEASPPLPPRSGGRGGGEGGMRGSVARFAGRRGRLRRPRVLDVCERGGGPAPPGVAPLAAGAPLPMAAPAFGGGRVIGGAKPVADAKGRHGPPKGSAAWGRPPLLAPQARDRRPLVLAEGGPPSARPPPAGGLDGPRGIRRSPAAHPAGRPLPQAEAARRCRRHRRRLGRPRSGRRRRAAPPPQGRGVEFWRRRPLRGRPRNNFQNGRPRSGRLAPPFRSRGGQGFGPTQCQGQRRPRDPHQGVATSDPGDEFNGRGGTRHSVPLRPKAGAEPSAPAGGATGGTWRI